MKVERQKDDTVTLTMTATGEEWDGLLDAINAVGRKSPDQKAKIAEFTQAVLKEGEGYLCYESPPPKTNGTSSDGE